MTTPANIAAFLIRVEPEAYCDKCLGQELYSSDPEDDIRTAALKVARGDGFRRALRVCRRCRLTRELTELTR